MDCKVKALSYKFQMYIEKLVINSASVHRGLYNYHQDKALFLKIVPIYTDTLYFTQHIEHHSELRKISILHPNQKYAKPPSVH
jgi:hypothetical protein